MIKVQPEEMNVIIPYIRMISGISLDASKAYLIESRLSDLAQTNGCRTFSDLIQKSKMDASQILQRKIIDAITTGETLFFRDTSPFELLQHKILPDLIDARRKASMPGIPVSIRIWSAACSTGQEVYSIGIVLKELLGDLSKYRIRLVGTDISDKAVAEASRGIYNRIQIERGLPTTTLTRFFSRSGDTWKINDEIRAMATFKTLNLFDDFRSLGMFDIVFCRNVAIYFSDTDRSNLFNRIERVMEPDGYLIIGSTESITGSNLQYESKRYLRSVYYQLKRKL